MHSTAAPFKSARLWHECLGCFQSCSEILKIERNKARGLSNNARKKEPACI